MKLEEILRKTGLSNGEIRVYLALLDLGSTSVNRIHEKTGIERRNIYDILNKLIERGMINYIFEQNKRHFQLANPNKILGYLDEKSHELDEVKREIRKEMPLLVEKIHSKKPRINAEIFRGLEGIKAVLEDTLNYKKMLFIGGGGYVLDKVPTFWKGYNKRRIKLGLKWYNLALENLRGHRITKERLMYTKFLPREFTLNPGVIWIFGNKVADILWTEDAFAFVIENKQIAENYKRYHEYLWNNVAKK